MYLVLTIDSLQRGLARVNNPSDEERIAALARVSRVRRLLEREATKLTTTQRYFVSQAPFLVSVGMTRLSVAMFITELVGAAFRKWRVAALTGVCLIGTWTVAAPLVSMVGCAPVESQGRWMCSGEVSAG